MHQEVLSCHKDRQLTIVTGDPQPVTKCVDDRHAPVFVLDMTRPLILGRLGFAQIVHEGGKANLFLLRDFGCGIQHHQRVHKCIALWMMLDILQHTLQRCNFRKDDVKGIAPLQHADEFTGVGLTQGAAGFLPDALGNQGSQLAGRADSAHEINRFRGNRKAALSVPGCKARDPQHPERIFNKGV